MSLSEQGYKSLAKPGTGNGDFNALSFLVRRILEQTNTATLVKVLAVTNSGEVSPVGFVDVQPMVNLLDGTGKPWPHTTIFNIPYARIQGGSNAIIIDPQVGDIGIALFAQHDISSVKANKATSNPGSSRRNDMADGIYIGGVLNGTPTQYVKFDSGGLSVVSPAGIVGNAPAISFGALGETVKALVHEAFIDLFNAHVHNETGSVTSVPTVLAGAGHKTITLKGE